MKNLTATPPVYWVIEPGIFGAQSQAVADAAQRLGCPVILSDRLTILSFTERVCPSNACVVFYGSLGLAAQIQRRLPWVPGVLGELSNYRCQQYFSHYGAALLNHAYALLPLRDLARRLESQDPLIQALQDDRGRIFLRPDSPFKPFDGQIIQVNDSVRETLTDLQHKNGLQNLDGLVSLSPPKSIAAEWRLIIHKGCVIAGSQYQDGTRLVSQSGFPPEAKALVEHWIRCWTPAPLFTLDLCQSEGDYHLLEIGCLSTSAFYACEIDVIVQAATSTARTLWEAEQ